MHLKDNRMCEPSIPVINLTEIDINEFINGNSYTKVVHIISLKYHIYMNLIVYV